MWKGRDLVSITDFTRSNLEKVFKHADIFLEAKLAPLKILEGKILVSAFFEPSTRTRLSFESAMLRLGGSVLGFSSVEGTSIEKGESIEDTIRTIDKYSDVIVVRHSSNNIMRRLAELAEHPVINAGEGKNSHPTQAIVDLYSIYKEKKNIENLEYGVMGDLRHARTVRDFIRGLSIFGVKEVNLIAPPSLMPDEDFLRSMEARGMSFKKYRSLSEIVSKLDVLYVVRIQVERFTDRREAEALRGSYSVTMRDLESAKKDMKILHPLPRVEEVSREFDSTPHAIYFKQVFYSIPVRMAILGLILTDLERTEESLI
ncbi:MAG: aspartate carbamoyltransferase [Thermoproteota archaeon]